MNELSAKEKIGRENRNNIDIRIHLLCRIDFSDQNDNQTDTNNGQKTKEKFEKIFVKVLGHIYWFRLAFICSKFGSFGIFNKPCSTIARALSKSLKK